jgi:hypothetical protein
VDRSIPDAAARAPGASSRCPPGARLAYAAPRSGDRQRSRPQGRPRQGAAHQGQDERESVGEEEAPRQVDDDQRDQHVERQQDRGRPGEQADEEGEAAEELDGDERDRRDRGQWHAEAPEEARRAGEAEGEQLLPAVDGEDQAEDQAQRQRGPAGDRHRASPSTVTGVSAAAMPAPPR